VLTCTNCALATRAAREGGDVSYDTGIMLCCAMLSTPRRQGWIFRAPTLVTVCESTATVEINADRMARGFLLHEQAGGLLQNVLLVCAGCAHCTSNCMF